jgi:hypothetical protein
VSKALQIIRVLIFALAAYAAAWVMTGQPVDRPAHFYTGSATLRMVEDVVMASSLVLLLMIELSGEQWNRLYTAASVFYCLALAPDIKAMLFVATALNPYYWLFVLIPMLPVLVVFNRLAAYKKTKPAYLGIAAIVLLLITVLFRFTCIKTSGEFPTPEAYDRQLTNLVILGFLYLISAFTGASAVLQFVGQKMMGTSKQF